jgi:hypothetical protein
MITNDTNNRHLTSLAGNLSHAGPWAVRGLGPSARLGHFVEGVLLEEKVQGLRDSSVWAGTLLR